MERNSRKVSSHLVLILALVIGAIAVGAGNSPVSAQACTAQLGTSTTYTQQYYGSGFQVTVPVSTSCSFYAGQLYATGTAYDTTYNSNIGSANTQLSSTYAGYGFSGQLQFNLPATAASHPVQFSVSIFGTGYGQQYYGGSTLATTSETYLVGPSYPNIYQNYPYSPNYPTNPAPTDPGYTYYPGNGYNQYPSHLLQSRLLLPERWIQQPLLYPAFNQLLQPSLTDQRQWPRVHDRSLPFSNPQKPLSTKSKSLPAPIVEMLGCLRKAFC